MDNREIEEVFKTFVCGHADMIVNLLKEHDICAKLNSQNEFLEDSFFPSVIVASKDSSKAWEILKINGFI